MQDEHAYALFATTGASSMQREDAVEVAVGWLAILESKLDEANVAGGGGAVQSLDSAPPSRIEAL